MNASSRQTLLPLAVGLSLLVGWHGLSLMLPPFLMAGPLEVLQAMVRHASVLATAAATTGSAALAGLGIAAITGLALGGLFTASRVAERALYPYALLVQTVPVIAIAPLLVVWLDYGWWVSTVSAAIVSFFPLLTGAHVGLRATDPDRLALLRLYGASPLQQLRLLRLPAALPHILAGLRTAGGLAVIGAVVGDFVGSNGQPPSLGFVVLKAAASADVARSFAAVVVSAILALVLFAATRALEQRTIGGWHGDRLP